MRTITTHTGVYPYEELSDKAKEKAREELYSELCEIGSVTELLRGTAADWLTNEGWTDLDPGEFVDGPDLEKLQFSICHSQGDFVAWASTRPWDYNGTEYTVLTTMRHTGGGYETMDVNVETDADVDPADLTEIQARAEEMVSVSRHTLLALLHETDLDLTDDEEYLSEFAEANEIEFTVTGSIHR
jgi:hypothetical protein